MGCGCGMRRLLFGGGGCSACTGAPGPWMSGGAKTKKKSTRKVKRCSYKATRRNKNLLKKWRAGKSIGFTARASLKAKGLIRRADGTRRVSKKYC